MRDEELITAYVDGVSELTPEERRRAEAAARERGDELAATREMLDQLRSLPDNGQEPDWVGMERAIGAVVGDRVPRSWWRLNLRWLVPALACATAAAIAIIVVQPWRGGEATPGNVVAHPSQQDDGPTVAIDPHAGHAFVYLDGQAVDVDDVPEAQILDGLKPDSAAAASDDDGDDDLLNSPGLAWVDQLDNAKLDRLETTLDEKRVAPPKKGS